MGKLSIPLFDRAPCKKLKVLEVPDSISYKPFRFSFYDFSDSSIRFLVTGRPIQLHGILKFYFNGGHIA